MVSKLEGSNAAVRVEWTGLKTVGALAIFVMLWVLKSFLWSPQYPQKRIGTTGDPKFFRASAHASAQIHPFLGAPKKGHVPSSPGNWGNQLRLRGEGDKGPASGEPRKVEVWRALVQHSSGRQGGRPWMAMGEANFIKMNRDWSDFDKE